MASREGVFIFSVGSNYSQPLFFPGLQYRQLKIEMGAEEEGFRPAEIAKAWGDWALQEHSEHGNLPAMDWHTPSWLNLNELKEALAQAGLEIGQRSPEFRAVVAAMEVLADHYGPEKVRLVFWFDG